MSGNLKRLSRDVAIYGAGRVSLQLLAFATLPFLTRVFTPADYGVIETAMTVTMVLMLLAPLGLEAGSQRSYFDYSDDEQSKRRSVLTTAATTMAVSSLLLGLALAAAAGPVAKLLLGSTEHAGLFVLVGATIPLTTLVNYVLEVYRLQHRPFPYVALTLFMGVVATGLTLYLVFALDLGVRGVFIAGLIAPALAFLIGLRSVARTVTGALSRRELRTMLAFGLPFVPVAAATWVIQLSDRFFVLKFASAGDLGLYSLGVKYSNLLMLPVTAFGIAWAPFFLALYAKDRDEERRVRSRTLSLVALGLTWAAVATAASSYAFFSVVTGPAFVDAYKVVALLVPGIVAVGMNTVLMSGISIVRSTHYFIRYTVYSAGLNLLLNFALIPTWGILGAALATSLTYAALAAMYGWRSQRVDPAPFDWSRLTRTLVLGGIWLVPASLLQFDHLLVELLVKTLLIAAFPLVAIRIGAVHPEILQASRAVVQRRLPWKTAAL